MGGLERLHDGRASHTGNAFPCTPSSGDARRKRNQPGRISPEGEYPVNGYRCGRVVGWWQGLWLWSGMKCMADGSGSARAGACGCVMLAAAAGNGGSSPPGRSVSAAATALHRSTGLPRRFLSVDIRIFRRARRRLQNLRQAQAALGAVARAHSLHSRDRGPTLTTTTFG